MISLNFASAAQLLIVVNGIILGAGLVGLRVMGRSVNPALPVIFFVFALQMIGEFAHQTRSNILLAELRAGLSLAYGPLIYLYFLNYVEPGRGLRWRDGWHGVPFVIAALTLAAPIYFGLFELSIHYYAAAAGVSLLAYMVIAWRNIRPRLNANMASRRIKWVIASAILSGLMLALTVVVTNFNCEFIDDGPILWTRNALLICILVLMNAFIFGGLWDSKVLFSEVNTGIADDESKSVVKLLNELLEKDRLFADPELSLERLAKALAIRPRRLSEAINSLHKISVPGYLNRRRIEEAKRLIADSGKSEKSLIDIALEAGLNSKATFNRVFKDIAGETPSSYRARIRPRGGQ